MTLDPDTLLPSSSVETEMPPELVCALWRNERLGRDLNHCDELARAAVPVATLSEHREVTLAGSERVQCILRPAGFGDELRAILRSNGTTLGAIALYREIGRGPFTGEERSLMADIAQGVAEGLRRSLVRRPSPGSDAGIVLPGVARFTEDGELRAATAEARRTIHMMPGDFASTLHTIAMDAAHNPEGARSRVRLPDGRWILVHGARLHGETSDESDMAVTLMPAPAREIVSMLMRLHSLTAREREVADLLMSGWATDAIASRLHISRHTLIAHTKAIFRTGGSPRCRSGHVPFLCEGKAASATQLRGQRGEQVLPAGHASRIRPD